MQRDRVRLAEPRDIPRLAAMRVALWPDGSLEEHTRELHEHFTAGPPGPYPYVILVAEAGGELIAFAEVTLRSYADGCDPHQPVGYLEGWYVDESHRRRGIGAALVRAAEEWARDHGCTEFASDTWHENEGAQQAHEALGFEIVDRVVNYRKPL